MIQLVKRSISGDADAFLELMEKNSLAMYKVARGILDNDEDAADAMQDTILTCFEKIHTLKNPEYFKTWMIRILINECNKIHTKKTACDERNAIKSTDIIKTSAEPKNFRKFPDRICPLRNLSSRKCLECWMNPTGSYWFCIM